MFVYSLVVTIILIICIIIVIKVLKRGDTGVNLNKKLWRSMQDKKIGGVCGGLGEWLEVDSTLVRQIVAFFTILGLGTMIPLYILAWLIIPKSPNNLVG